MRMPEIISIKTNVVSAAGDDIALINTEMGKTFEEIGIALSALASKWDSDGSRAHMAKFNSFKQQFPEHSNTIMKYSKFLKDSAAAYDNREKGNVDGTNNLG